MHSNILFHLTNITNSTNVWCNKKKSFQRFVIYKYSPSLRVDIFYTGHWQQLQLQNHLGYVCMSYLDSGIFACSSMQICSSIAKLNWEHQRTAISRSSHIFSMGYKSGSWLSHSRMLTLFSSYAFVVCEWTANSSGLKQVIGSMHSVPPSCSWRQQGSQSLLLNTKQSTLLPNEIVPL